MRTLALLAVVVVPALLLAAPVPKDKEKVKDEDAILGTWAIDKFDADGGNAPSQPNEIKFVFAEKGKFTMDQGGPDHGDRGGATYKIDPTAMLKEMDLSLHGESFLAIYELNGDTLKICIPYKPNSARPTEFVANGKAGISVVTFKRVKDEKKDDKKDK